MPNNGSEKPADPEDRNQHSHGKVIWPVIAGGAIVVGIVGTSFFLGRATRPDAPQQELANIDSNASPIASKGTCSSHEVLRHFAETVLYDIEVEYDYSTIPAAIWKAIQWGRVPPAFYEGKNETRQPRQPKFIETPRSKLGTGELLMLVHCDNPDTQTYQLTGRGHYNDQLLTTPNQDGPTIDFTWGITVRLKDGVPLKNIQHGATVDMLLDVLGAATSLPFSGSIKLSRDTGLVAGRIDLYFAGNLALRLQEVGVPPEQIGSILQQVDTRKPIAWVTLKNPHRYQSCCD
jgi:hypothetical protein